MMMANNANPLASVDTESENSWPVYTHTHIQKKNNKIVADISTNNNAKIKDKVEAVKTNMASGTAETEQKRRIRQEGIERSESEQKERRRKTTTTPETDSE